ncbi:MAG TPA: helix-turn-helix domain-containing protein [Bryobacteraceae bacterium]|nr:helix-turn-helix domain-containing protein [Bryobacteraceae bacterium]
MMSPKTQTHLRNAVPEKLLHCGSVLDRLPDNVAIMETPTSDPKLQTNATETERLAYSVQEAADLLGVNYFSVYRLIQRGKLRACRALRGKLLVPRSELLRLLNS